MTDREWQYMERLLSTGVQDEWIHFISDETSEYIETHQNNIEEVEEMQKAYMFAYDDADELVNPDIKYNGDDI